MIGRKTTIAIAFATTVCVTLIIPSFPPAHLLFNLLGLPQATMVIFGVSIATLIAGIINGVFWTMLAATTYVFTQLVMPTKKLKPLTPLPVAHRLSKPLLDNLSVDSWLKEVPLVPLSPAKASRRMREKPGRAVRRPKPLPIKFPNVAVGTEMDIEVIEGIGSTYGGVLKILGIGTLGDLLRIGATERGRHRLAKEIGVTPAIVLKWVYRGNMLLRRGTESNYSIFCSRNDKYDGALYCTPKTQRQSPKPKQQKRL